MKKLLGIAFLLTLGFWACHLGPEDTTNHFDVVGDTAWTKCDTMELLLLDDTGKVLDTLFHDSLRSVSQLTQLDAGRYQGGKARIRIKGYFKNGDVCVDETRSFEDGGTGIVVEKIKDPSAMPDSVVSEPAFLSLVAGGPAAKVKGKVLPLFVDQGLFWSLDASGVATLDVGADTAVSEVSVTPVALGEGLLTLRSRKDGSKLARVRVRVNAASAVSVSLDYDSLQLFAGGAPDSLKAVVLPHLADQAVSWSSLDATVAKVDAAGKVSPLKAGRTHVFATTANGKKDSALIVVVADVPKLVIASRSGAAVNVEIEFTPTVTQKVGHLVLFAWDLQGDGTWDDSLTGPWHGDSVKLDPVSAKYAAEGLFKARFRVRDSEGNTVVVEVPVDIGNQAPEILALRADTVISVKDSIAMTATVKDGDGKVAWVGWDYEGDGQYDDTLVTNDVNVEVVLGHRFHEAGNYLAIFKAVDGNGKARLDTVRIKVEFDEPVADMGNDTTVLVNASFIVSVKGTDKFGPIVKRELKIGDGAFIALSKQDTVIKAPAAPATLTFVGRVTDSDGLTDTDTLKVTVILSANADLSSLVFSAGDLVPAFKPSSSNYAAQAAFTDSLVRVTPTAKDPAATITVNAKPVASGAASDAVKLAVGANNNAFQILVTAPDGSQRTYSVSVARNPNAEATLKSLTGTGFVLKPAFSPSVLEYVDTVTSAVASITLRPTVASAGATVAINDSGIASGTPSAPLPLKHGDNAFQVVVTAMDGLSKTAYNVKVVRLAKLVILRKLGAAAAVPADSAELPLGAARSLSSPGATGYLFSRWSLLEGSATLADSGANPTTLTMGAGLVRVQATFTLNRYTITGTVTGCGTMNPPAGTSSFDHNATVNYTLTPSAGCRISSVRIDGTEDSSAHDGTYTFSNLAANRTIAAAFVRTFVLKSKAGSGGRITPDSVKVDSGKVQVFTVSPDSGKRIQKVTLDGSDRGNTNVSQSVTADKDHLLEAAFIAGYTLAANITLGAGSVTPGSVGVDSGQSASFTFTPAANYRFLDMTDNGKDVSPTTGTTQYALTGIDRPHTINIRFRRQYTVTVTASGPGRVVGTAGVLDSASNNSYVLTPDSGAVISALTVDGVATAPPANNTIAFNGLNAGHTIAVTFLRRHTIATTWGTTGNNHVGGSVTPENPLVNHGANQSFTITPDAANGYKLVALTVDGSPATLATSYSFTNVTAPHTLNAVFRRGYRMTGVAHGGTITPADTVVDDSHTMTWNFAALPDYVFESLTDNGSPAVATNNYTRYSVAGVTAPHDVVVRFKRRYNVVVNASGPGQVTGGPAGSVDSGATREFKITPTGNAFILSMVANGVAIAPPQFSHIFEKISRHCTLTVVFRNRFTISTIVTNPAGGSLSPMNPLVDSTGSQRVTITTLTGYRLSALSIDKSTASLALTEHTFGSVVNNNRSIEAAFTKTWKVTGTAMPAAAGSVAPADTTVDDGGSVPFRFGPSGLSYRVNRMSCNGVAQNLGNNNTQYSLIGIKEAVACTVYFSSLHNMVGSAGTNGEVTPKDTWVEPGSTHTWTITPSSGYRVEAVFDNETQVKSVGSDLGTHTYSISNIGANHTVRATFKRYFEYKAGASNGGSITPDGGWVDEGGTLTFTMTNNAKFALTGFTVDEKAALSQVLHTSANTSTFTLNGVSGNHVFIANFSAGVAVELKDTVLPALDPFKQSYSKPQLCIYWSEDNTGKSICGNLAGKWLPLGIEVTVTAPPEVNVCTGRDCSERRPFFGWTPASAILRPVSRETKYSFGLKESNVFLAANYTSGQ